MAETTKKKKAKGGADAVRDFVAEQSGVQIEGDTAKGNGAAKGAGEEITRPNGELYMTRSIAGMSCVDFIARCAEHGLFVRLAGPAGTGKTALAEAFCARHGRALVVTECDPDMPVEALVGGYLPEPGGTFAWRYGDLPNAMSAGKVWFADDITAAEGRVLVRTYPALDSRRRLTVKEHEGEVIEAESGFFAICAYNPGVSEMSEPLQSRFGVEIEVRTDFDAARKMGVPKGAVKLAERLNRLLDQGETSWAPQMRELLGFRDLVEAFDERTAAENLLGCCPEEERDRLAEEIDGQLTGGVAVRPLRLG